MSNMISITGELGSGKSTVCRILSAKYGFRLYQTGVIQRKIAEKYNMTTLELNKYSETHPEIDEEIDQSLARLAEESEQIIFDSRMAWHFVPNSFKVYLSADMDVAIQRIVASDRGQVEVYSDPATAKQLIRERKTSENCRYLSKYGVDCCDMNNYDLILDTSYSSPEVLADLIMNKYRSWLSDSTYVKFWLSPKLTYPTHGIRNMRMSDIEELMESIRESGFLESHPINIAKCRDFYYIIDGHRRAAAAALAQIELVPAVVIGQDETVLPIGVSVCEYVVNPIGIVYDWEELNRFHYDKYPATYTNN